jgi:hypothetical protein
MNSEDQLIGTISDLVELLFHYRIIEKSDAHCEASLEAIRDCVRRQLLPYASELSTLEQEDLFDEIKCSLEQTQSILPQKSGYGDFFSYIKSDILLTLDIANDSELDYRNIPPETIDVLIEPYQNFST